MKALIAIVFLCASLGLATAQAPASQAPNSPKPSPRKATVTVGRSECATGAGLCVTVPAAWKRLGNVFDDLGFVVAEPHPGADSATWPQLTVAAIDVPPAKGSNGAAGASPSLDALVDIVLTPDGSFTSAETLQRTHLILNGAEAEIVRVRLHDDPRQSEVIEEVALIAGDDGLVYSIALRCAPQDFARLDPVFQKAAGSWRVKSLAPAPPVPAPPAKLQQDSRTK